MASAVVRALPARCRFVWAVLALLVTVPLRGHGEGESVFVGEATYPTGEITITDGYYYWDPEALNADGTKGKFIDVTPVNQSPAHPLPLTVPSFKGYIYGVVRKEISNPGGVDAVRNRIWRVQAIAAASRALTTLSMIANNSINGTTDVQAFEQTEWPESLELELRAACDTVLNDRQAIKYKKKKVTNSNGTCAVVMEDVVIDAEYFSGNSAFTKNSGDEQGDYVPYLRRSRSGLSGTDIPAECSGVHCLGMNQTGMKVYAATAADYEAIVQKYYHPAPPIVRSVKVLVDSDVKWQSSWAFNYSKDAPARVKTTDPSEKLSITDDLRFEIMTSESMAHKSSGTCNLQEGTSLFKLMLKYDGNSESYEVPLTRMSADTTRRSYVGTLTSTKMKELGMAGNVTLSMDGYHFYATTWRLDKNPATVSFDKSSSYEVGADENHVIQITCPIDLESASIGEEPVSGRTHVLTLNFVETVKNVSVVAPEGLAEHRFQVLTLDMG